MAVEIVQLAPSLKREVTALGTSEYSSVAESEWIGHLTDAFWEARLMGLLAGWTEVDGEIVPQAEGGAEIPRDLQHLIVLFAGFRMAITSYRNINSGYRAKAGPVEYEVQKSAQTLAALIDAIKSRIDFILKNLSTLGNESSNSIAIFDAVINANQQEAAGSWYVGG